MYYLSIVCIIISTNKYTIKVLELTHDLVISMNEFQFAMLHFVWSWTVSLELEKHKWSRLQQPEVDELV